ncbi:uncharacterized protein LOC119727862 [Patiria miniata]|uniref:Death domain-containing protein n=1 Tax=Patiria miniata TaxID=46514 RepID=A0A913ZWG7_PATMI|nr:uncharacterized protein LOC119727862 [Patiria miniata]
MDLPVPNAQAVSDYFRRILTAILEELVDKVPNHGYISNTEIVKQSLRSISNLYKSGLRFANSGLRSDWNDPANRCAYVFLYLMHHCYLVYGSLQYSDEVIRSWRNRSSLKVCSIGGGPGSDLVGLTTFLRMHGIFPRSLECLVFDLYPNWKDTWDTIYTHLQDTFSVTYHMCDLVKDTLGLHIRDLQFIKQADILTLSKSFSAVSAFFRADSSKGAFLRDVLQQTKPGCLVLYIDNEYSGCTQFQRDFASRAGMDLVFEFRGKPTSPKGAYSDIIQKYNNLFEFTPMRSCNVTIQLFRKKGAAPSGPHSAVPQGFPVGIFSSSSRSTPYHDVISSYGGFHGTAMRNTVTPQATSPQLSSGIPLAASNVYPAYSTYNQPYPFDHTTTVERPSLESYRTQTTPQTTPQTTSRLTNTTPGCYGQVVPQGPPVGIISSSSRSQSTPHHDVISSFNSVHEMAIRNTVTPRATSQQYSASGISRAAGNTYPSHSPQYSSGITRAAGNTYPETAARNRPYSSHQLRTNTVASQDVDEFDDEVLENVANLLDQAWPTVATYLSFDDDECQAIIEAHPGRIKQQALQMLTAWRAGYAGPDILAELKGALRAVGLHTLLPELGGKILENPTLQKVAESVGNKWRNLAHYLSFDVEQCRNIQAAFATTREQAGQMIAAWRQSFTGDNPVQFLATALIAIGHDDLARELGEEILESPTLQKVARSVDNKWLRLAQHLSFDVEQCRDIQAAFSTTREQAGQMIAAWRQSFTGDNPVQYLALALIAIGRDDLARELGRNNTFPPKKAPSTAAFMPLE